MQLSLPNKPDQYTGPLILALLVLISQAIGLTTLAYDRSLIESSEVWRIITGNLVHLNAPHLGLNLLGVLFLWLLHGDDYRLSHYLIVALTAGLSVTLGLYAINPALDFYAGLSGVLHGLFVWGVILDFLAKRKTAWLLASGLVAKLVAEVWLGGDSATEMLLGAPVVTQSHLYGTVGGLAAGLVLTLAQRATAREQID